MLKKFELGIPHDTNAKLLVIAQVEKEKAGRCGLVRKAIAEFVKRWEKEHGEIVLGKQ